MQDVVTHPCLNWNGGLTKFLNPAHSDFLLVKESPSGYGIFVAQKHTIHTTRGPFYLHGLTLIRAWISNYIHYKVWNEIIYPFL